MKFLGKGGRGGGIEGVGESGRQADQGKEGRRLEARTGKMTFSCVHGYGQARHSTAATPTITAAAAAAAITYILITHARHSTGSLSRLHTYAYSLAT